MSSLLEQVRHRARLSQVELAERAGTSRTTLSAYEHGRKSPTLATVERVLDSAGFELVAEPRVEFTVCQTRRFRPFALPNRLWRLPLGQAFAEVMLPLELNWSSPGHRYVLSDRRQRQRCYEIVLQEGQPADLRTYIDGALLVDSWDEIIVPRDIRTAWQPLIDEHR
jgi:transcriptional regulator with XRE-family HTH domain